MADQALIVAAPDDPDPESFIGRLAAAYFDPPGSFFEGEVISFDLPHDDDSPEAAAEGTLFKVRFCYGDEFDYYINELKNI